MSAAVSAAGAGARVLVATKSALGAGNTGRAQGGIQAAVGDDDSTESHFEDTFAAGHRTARPELVRRLADGGPDAIAWLAAIGVSFTRDEGRLRLLRCGGATRKRLLQAGERTGAEMVKALRAAVRASRRRGLGVDDARRPGARGRRMARDAGARRQRHAADGARPRGGAGGRRRAARRGRRARDRQHEPPGRHPRGAADGAGARRRGPRARLVAAPPHRVGLAGEPRRVRPARDHPCLRGDAARRRRRALRRRARPARRGRPGDHRHRRGGPRRRGARRQRRRLARHHRDRPRERRRASPPSASPTSTTAT